MKNNMYLFKFGVVLLSRPKYPKIKLKHHFLVKIPNVDKEHLAPRNILPVILCE